MSARKAIIAAMLVGVLSVGGYYGYRYFLHPDGINLAASEICAQNGTEIALVFHIEANQGAKFIALVEPGDDVCAPSPVSPASGLVIVEESEGAGDGCLTQVTDGGRVKLESYVSENRCLWD